MSELTGAAHPERARRRRRLLVLFATVLVSVLLLTVLAAWLNSRAYGDLLNAVERSESMLSGYVNEVESFENTAPAGSSPQLRQLERQRNAARAAKEVLPDVLVEVQLVRDVQMWPWDRDAMQARDRYADHLAVWEEHLRAFSRGDFETADAVAEIRATETLAERALTGAVPVLDGDYASRVEALFPAQDE